MDSQKKSVKTAQQGFRLRWTLRRKIGGFAALLLGLIVLVSVYSYTGFESVGYEVRRIAQADLPMTRAITSVQYHLLQCHLALQRILLLGSAGAAPSPQQLNQPLMNYVRSFHLVEEGLRDFQRLSEQEADAAARISSQESNSSSARHEELFATVGRLKNALGSFQTAGQSLIDAVSAGELALTFPLAEGIQQSARRADDIAKILLDQIEAFSARSVEQAHKNEILALQTLLSVGAAAFAIGILLTGLIVGRMRHNLGIVGKQAHTLSQSAARDHIPEERIAITSTDEIGELSYLFNQMMDSLDRALKDRRQAHKMLTAANEGFRRSDQALRKALVELSQSHLELKTAQLGLIRTAKAESITRLATGIAHEVKNPLSIILQGIDFLKSPDTVGDPNTPAVLGRMQNAILRADKVIEGLLDCSQSKGLSLLPEHFNTVAEKALAMVQYDLNKTGIKVVTEFGEGIPRLGIDRGKLEQVFVNLLSNAIHAMPDGGTLTLRTYTRSMHFADIPKDVPLQNLHPGNEATAVVAEICDTGPGISEEDLPKIFDPFFTTKPTGEGMGLGLAVTEKIMDLHNGKLQIENRQEGGVKAVLTFLV
ncbi:MAG: hypothetical protein JW937_08505 [Candidatus Omnitrophica bacterium]|nr:hypothetical protein [Candidatus Omnitrophota bacterium]